MTNVREGQLSNMQSAFVHVFRTTEEDLKPGQIVKIIGNMTVGKVTNNTEYAIGIVDGNWDRNKLAVPVIIRGMVYIDGEGLTPGTPINISITPIGGNVGSKIITKNGTTSDKCWEAWVCA